MKKILSLAFALLILVLPCVNAQAAIYNNYLEGGFYSECVYLVCTDNDEIIFAKDQNKQNKPASMTKIVTATVVLDEVEDLTQMVTIQQSCIDELFGTGSSAEGFKAGEQYSVYDMLCCLLIESANDAATNLAYFVTGDDRQAFIDKMNAVAQELGCENTNFVNVHGLDDDDQYTTAADMAKLLKNAMKHREFSEITSMTTYTLPASEYRSEKLIRTTNFTLVSSYKDYYCKYINAGKTGFTNGAGQCLTVSASNNGYNYIAVAMNGSKEDYDEDGYDENGAFMDCRAMLDWAFSNLRLVSIADAAKIVAEVPVKLGKGADHVTLCPSDTAFSLMPVGIDSGSLLVRAVESTVPDYVYAPVKKGETICKGEVLYAGEVIAQIDLVTSTAVKRSFISYLASQIAQLFAKPAVKLLAVIIVAIFIILLVLRRKGLIKTKHKTYDVVNYNDFFDSGKKQ